MQGNRRLGFNACLSCQQESSASCLLLLWAVAPLHSRRPPCLSLPNHALPGHRGMSTHPTNPTGVPSPRHAAPTNVPEQTFTAGTRLFLTGTPTPPHRKQAYSPPQRHDGRPTGPGQGLHGRGGQGNEPKEPPSLASLLPSLTLSQLTHPFHQYPNRP